MEDVFVAIGERIKFFRTLRGMTQKGLGMAIGFSEGTADVRVAQYESGTRSPKEKYVDYLAGALNVSPLALIVPDIDSDYGLIHTLFACEDIYGLKADRIDGSLCLSLDKSNPNYLTMFDMINKWQHESERLKSGEITKDEYDSWRYRYPEVEYKRFRVSIDSLRAKKSAD
jgi:transcriptional regulator with XRE-family HTH domain